MLIELAVWLRQQREIRGWARREMARRLIDAGHDAGDNTMPDIDHVCYYIRRWENGQCKSLTERYKLYYCTALSIPPEQYRKAAHPGIPAPGFVAYRGTYTPEMGGFTVEREVQMTAHESSDHAGQAGQPGLGDTTIDQLRADVTRLARLHDAGEPFQVFLEMRRVRDRIHRLLDRRLWPREQADLYLLLGCLDGMMGGTANYLGYPEAAEELIRAAWAYADAIDHGALRGWLRLELSIVMYDRGRFEDSLGLAVSGLTYLPVGTQGADLHIRQAYAAARLGDAETARRAVHEAHEARDPGYNDDLQEMGGKFLISQATHHCFAGAALAAIGGAEREAAGELEQAIGLYDEGPRGREQHWFAGRPLASIDLAMVRLRSGALDAAAAALEPVFSLAPAQRISRVTARMAAVRDELTAPVFRGSGQARELGARIEEFGCETIVAGLHSLPGG